MQRVRHSPAGRRRTAWALPRAVAGALVVVGTGAATLVPTAAATGRDNAREASAGPALPAAHGEPLTALGPAAAGSLLATPLLSPARLPRTLQALWAARTLSAALAKAMGPRALGRTGAAASCAEVAQGGRTLYSDHPRLPVIPASNMKLVTATALLSRLGGSYTFTTSLEATATPIGGVVAGNLYLVGGGDPLLRLPSYAASVPDGGHVYTNVDDLVTALKAAGVHEVAGSVVADESRFDSVRSVASWPATYSEEGDVGPLSAVGIDDGFATAEPLVPDSAPPPVQSAGLVTMLLRQAGVKVDGPPVAGRAPAGARAVAEVVSPPLRAELREILLESDNTAMELLTKELGYKTSGTGSTAAGVAAVRAALAADGSPLAGFVNVDGSGLSRQDRVTCALLLDVLQRAGPNGLLVQDLPVAGRSGTLADELNGTAAAGRVYAKTGTLNGVKALSGWARAAPGQGTGNPALAAPVVFATVLNGLAPVLPDPGQTPAGLTDQVALEVAEYPQAPELGRFEPGVERAIAATSG